MGKTLRLIVLGLAALVSGAPLPAPAQDRAIGVKPIGESKTVRAYPHMHALCIGINNYVSPGIPSLSYAEADAHDVAAVLRDLYGFDDVRALLGKEATRQGITAAIAELFDPQRIGSDDAVIIYFSGHGQTVRQGQSEVGYLVPQDADISLKDVANPKPYRRDAIPMQQLQADADGVPAKHVLFLIDACYSGYVASKGLEDAPHLANALKYRARQVITAGTAGEQSLEHPAWRHGAFTYKLLEILRVEDRPLQASALGVMLKERVPREVAAKFGKERSLSPQAKYLSGDGDFLFIRPGAIFDGSPEVVGRPAGLATVPSSKPNDSSQSVALPLDQAISGSPLSAPLELPVSVLGDETMLMVRVDLRDVDKAALASLALTAEFLVFPVEIQRGVKFLDNFWNSGGRYIVLAWGPNTTTLYRPDLARAAT